MESFKVAGHHCFKVDEHQEASDLLDTMLESFKIGEHQKVSDLLDTTTVGLIC